MKVPLQVRMGAALAGVHAKDFAVGWANGVVRWNARLPRQQMSDEIPENPFAQGSVKFAASAAAIVFMRSLSR